MEKMLVPSHMHGKKRVPVAWTVFVKLGVVIVAGLDLFRKP